MPKPVPSRPRSSPADPLRRFRWSGRHASRSRSTSGRRERSASRSRRRSSSGPTRSSGSRAYGEGRRLAKARQDLGAEATERGLDEVEGRLAEVHQAGDVPDAERLVALDLLDALRRFADDEVLARRLLDCAVLGAALSGILLPPAGAGRGEALLGAP